MAEYRRVKRKFHDAWAFILFLLFTATINAFYIMKGKPKDDFASKSSISLGAISYNFGFIVAFILIILLLLATIPGPLMHFSFIAQPIISICLCFFFNFHVASIVISIFLATVSLLFYFSHYKHNIRYSAAITKDVVRIYARNSIPIMFLMIISAAVMLAQILVCFMHTTNDLKEQSWMHALCLLQMFWTFFTFTYAMRVFVSTIVGLEVLSMAENIGFFYESIKNTFFSLGSICFGALIIALVTTAKCLNNANTRDNQRERNTFAVILGIIASIVLYILEAVVEFINSWAYVYMALYGTSYMDSIKQSFEVICRGDNNILVNSICLLPALSFLTFAFGVLYFLGFTYLFVPELGIEQMFPAVLSTFFVILTMELFVSSIDSSVKAFLFAADANPERIKQKYSRSASAIEEQISKIPM